MQRIIFLLLALIVSNTALASPALPSDVGCDCTTNPIAETKGVVWNQDPGDPSGYVIIASEYIPNYDILVIACDDFQPTSDATINKIRWYGGYWSGFPSPFSEVHVLFYNNSGSTPEQSPVYNQTFSYSDTYESLWSNPGYYYTIPSIPPFSVTAGTTYWVGVYVTLNYPPYWGIYYASGIWGSTVVQQSQDYFGDLNWHVNSKNVDWAFQLLAIPDEVQPTSLGMLKVLLK